jgi:PPM family protein phosphatase
VTSLIEIARENLTDRPAERLINGWRVAGAVVAERAGAGQDRAAIVPIEGGLVVVVADGAGGRGGGAEAADAVIEGVVTAANGAADPWKAQTWVDVLQGIDARVAAAGHGGESTAVVLALGESIAGASVGDSAAWLLEPAGATELTRGQRRRPMIGSGSAVASRFVGHTGPGTVLVASDGFAKYAPPAKGAALAMAADLAGAVERLIDLVKLRSGALQDDVTVALCRRDSHGG